MLWKLIHQFTLIFIYKNKILFHLIFDSNCQSQLYYTPLLFVLPYIKQLMEKTSAIFMSGYISILKFGIIFKLEFQLELIQMEHIKFILEVIWRWKSFIIVSQEFYVAFSFVIYNLWRFSYERSYIMNTFVVASGFNGT